MKAKKPSHSTSSNFIFAIPLSLKKSVKKSYGKSVTKLFTKILLLFSRTVGKCVEKAGAKSQNGRA